MLGSFDIGAGLLAVSGFIGWAVAVAVVWGGDAGRRTRRGQRARWAVALAAGSIVARARGPVGWSRVEGGVIDPFAYLDERFGPVAYLNILVAGAVAFLRAR